MHKAHYVLLNIECDQKTLAELTGAFRFSDAVLRHLVINMERRSPSPRRWREPPRKMRRIGDHVASATMRAMTTSRLRSERETPWHMSRFFRRKKFCRFTAEGVEKIDYKDLATLKNYITETGKIVPSRITGTKSFYQRQLQPRSSARASWRCCPTPISTEA